MQFSILLRCFILIADSSLAVTLAPVKTPTEYQDSNSNSDSQGSISVPHPGVHLGSVVNVPPNEFESNKFHGISSVGSDHSSSDSAPELILSNSIRERYHIPE